MARIPKKGTPQKTQKPVARTPKLPENTVLKPTSKNENIFIFSVLAAYFIIGLIGVFHHEMWRDELQIWLLGAANKSFSEFLHNMQGQPSPLLWILINFALGRISDNPLICQIAHFLVATGSVYLILKYSPFTRLQKVFLCFSYYILFEYSIIARGYGLTVFFLLLFCAFYQIKSKNRYLILALFLCGLSNSAGGEGIILTICLLGMMVIDYYFSEDTSIRKKYKPMQFLIGIGITLIGVYIAMKWLTPSAGNTYGNKWITNFDTDRLKTVLRTFWMSFLPIPNYSIVGFWNSNLFYSTDSNSVAFNILFFFSLSILISCILMYSKKLSIAAFYLAATGFILLFCYANNVIFLLFAVRHYGFLFITFVAAAWLAPGVKKTKFIIPGVNSLRNKLNIEKKFTYIVTGLFAVSMLGGIIAYSKDYALPFSSIEATGNYITSHHLDKLPEEGFIDYSVSPISAFTKQPIYFPDRDTSARYTTWDDKKFSFNMQVVIPRIANFVSHQKDSVVFISTGDYLGIGDGKVIDNIQFTKIASFYGSVVVDEVYIIYMARKFDLNKMMQDSSSYKNPSTLAPILSVANDLVQNGKLDDAGKILMTVEEKTYGRAVPYLHDYFGKLYTKENKQADAEKEFQTEISLNLQKEDAFFNLGMLYFQNKDYDKAIASWDSTIAINPKNADAYNNMGVCYLNFKKDNTKGMAYFEKAVELNPGYTQGYFNILVCAQNNNDEQTMIKYIRILLDKGTTVNDIKAKGITITDALLQKVNAR